MSTWRDQWQPLVEAVGTDFSTGVEQVAPRPVERSFIRRFLEPLELGCPLHDDPSVAAACGHPDLVAPVSSITSLTIKPLWSPGDAPLFTSEDRNAQPARPSSGPRRTGLEPAATAYFATQADAEFLRPVHVGDRLTRSGLRLVACAPKETSVGRGAFLTFESVARDQNGEPVARFRNTGYSYVPHEARPSAAPAPGVGRVAVAESVPENRPVDWSRQRSWREVAPGDQLAPVAFPLSVYRLVVAAAANGDFNSIHHNSEVAQATGAPEMYANTIFLQGMWERCVREYIGVGGEIRGWSGFRMRSFNTVGDTVVVRGEVTDRWQVEGDQFLSLRVWSENRRGVSVGPGVVTVTLP